MRESFAPALGGVWIDRQPGDLPPCLFNQRAFVECGCSVYLGVRTDTSPPETVTLGVPCGPFHRARMERFNDLMRWSLADGGTDRPLVDVVEDLLVESAREAA